MTGRIGAMAIDGTPISANDVARMEAEELLHTEWQRKAVLVVAASAADADDCRLLLDILGLDADVVANARRSAEPAVVDKPAPKRSPRAA
ncbi:MAG: hypothetical protein QOG22_3014 [Pseudonocardiales bacterium]|jgi:hypothetical protein|nr:hypothetical protein [Pseudonocardiales bacterium]